MTHWEINNIQKPSELTENPKLLWSHLKSLKGVTKSSTSNVVPPQERVEQNCYILKMKRKITKNVFYIVMLIQI